MRWRIDKASQSKITTAFQDYGNLPLKDLYLFTIKSSLRAEIFFRGLSPFWLSVMTNSANDVPRD